MKKSYKIMKPFVIVVLVFFVNTLFSQNFYGGIKGGFNMSQVDGDGFGGYKKIAPFGGTYVRTEFNNMWAGMLGIKYKHKGAKEVRRNEAGVVHFKHEIRLDYIEVPVTISYKIERIVIPSLIDYEFKNDFYIEFGISYAYLLKAQEIEADGSLFTPVERPYHNYDFLTHQGITYRLNNNFLINFRHCWTFFFFMLPARKHPGGQTFRFNHGEYNRNAEFSIMFEF